MRKSIKKGGFIRSGSIQHFRGIKKSLKNKNKKLQRKGGGRKTRRKSNKKGGFIRAGSIQHFRGVKKSIKNKKGGFIRSGSIQHFRGVKKRNISPEPVDPYMRYMEQTSEVDS